MIGKEWGIVTKYLTFSTGAKNATYTMQISCYFTVIHPVYVKYV